MYPDFCQRFPPYVLHPRCTLQCTQRLSKQQSRTFTHIQQNARFNQPETNISLQTKTINTNILCKITLWTITELREQRQQIPGDIVLQLQSTGFAKPILQNQLFV